MDKGLRNILNRIASEPSNKVLQSRFLALASELSEPARLDAVLAIAKIYVSVEPEEAIRMARMVREDHPQEYRDRATNIIREALSPNKQKSERKQNKVEPEASAKKIRSKPKKSSSKPKKSKNIEQSDFTKPKQQVSVSKGALELSNGDVTEKEVYAFEQQEHSEKEVIVFEGTKPQQEVNENDTFVDLVLDQIPSSSNKSIEIARKQKQEAHISQRKTAFFTVDVEPTVSKMCQIGMTVDEVVEKNEIEKASVLVDSPEFLEGYSSRASFYVKNTALPSTLEDKEVLHLLQFLYGDFPDKQCVSLLESRVAQESSFSLKAFYCVSLVRNGRARQSLFFIQSAFKDVSPAQKEHLDAIYSEIALSLNLPEQANYLERRVLPEFVRRLS